MLIWEKNERSETCKGEDFGIWAKCHVTTSTHEYCYDTSVCIRHKILVDKFILSHLKYHPRVESRWLSFKANLLDADNTFRPQSFSLSVKSIHLSLAPLFPPLLFSPCLSLSVASLFPLSNTDMGTPTDFIFLEEKDSAKWGEREKERDHKVLWTEKKQLEGTQSSLLAPVWYQQGGTGCINRALPLYLYSFYLCSTKPPVIWIIQTPQKLPPKVWLAWGMLCALCMCFSFSLFTTQDHMFLCTKSHI